MGRSYDVPIPSVFTNVLTSRSQDPATELVRLKIELHRLADSVGLGADALARTVKPTSAFFPNESYKERLRIIAKNRRRPGEFLPAKLFADPAWDMLLELYQSDIAGIELSVSPLCAASGVPMTIALRWLCTLEEEGLVVRQQDRLDARRI